MTTMDDAYVAQLNAAVEADRPDLVDELADTYLDEALAGLLAAS